MPIYAVAKFSVKWSLRKSSSSCFTSRLDVTLIPSQVITWTSRNSRKRNSRNSSTSRKLQESCGHTLDDWY